MKELTASIRRTFSVFRKSLREMRRDWLTLSLTMIFAPLFIFLYWLITAGGSTSYGVALINQDQGVRLADGTQVRHGEQIMEALTSVQYANGQPILKVVMAADQAEAEGLLRERAAAAFILIPADFSQAVEALRSGGQAGQPAIQVIFGGDLTNPYYTVAGVMAITAVDGYIAQVTGQPPLVTYVEQALGASGSRTEFEMYVPGVLVFSIIMLIFLAAMVVAREVESGTLRRLQLTPLRASEFLGGISAALMLVGLACVALTFLTALGTGFRSQGSLWLAGLVAALACLSVIGMGLVVASFSRTVSQAFVIANFPLGLFMFFSGSIYPLPKVVLFTVGKQAISLYDVLPPTHAVSALNKIFTLGAGIGELGYEMGALIILSILYFAAGVWLFQRTRLR